MAYTSVKISAWWTSFGVGGGGTGGHTFERGTRPPAPLDPPLNMGLSRPAFQSHSISSEPTQIHRVPMTSY